MALNIPLTRLRPTYAQSLQPEGIIHWLLLCSLLSLYLLGDPEDPIAVWKKLADQFHKKTLVNKLELRCKFHSLWLRDGNSIQQHIKEITELFEGLSVVGDAVSEEDRAVFC